MSWGVFVQVQASILPLGHTHTDIDQMFSRTATRLHNHAALTLNDLQEQLRGSYKPAPTVNHIKNVANFSGLCDAAKLSWDAKSRPYSQYRYFKISRTDVSILDRQSDEQYKKNCVVKLNSMDDWEQLRPDWDGAGFGAFIHRTPDLSKTPNIFLKAPTNKAEVFKRLVSEETRISS